MSSADLTADAVERLAACKAYMRVDYDDDDELICGLIDANAGYLAGAGIDRAVSPAMYDFVLNAMTLEQYDGRGADTPQQALQTVPPVARQMFNQLKLRCAYGGDADGAGG